MDNINCYCFLFVRKSGEQKPGMIGFDHDPSPEETLAAAKAVYGQDVVEIQNLIKEEPKPAD